MNEETKEKLNHYNRMSSLYFNAVLLISGGIVGLFYASLDIRTIIFVIIAVYFDFICISRHIEYNNLIEKITKKEK